MESYQSERIVNLKYLLVKLAKLWKWIAAAAAACAILLPLYRFLQLRSAYQKELAAFEQGVKDAVEPAPVSFPFSYIVIGLILGAVLAALVIFLWDFFGGKVKCASELDKPKNAQLLAVFKYTEDTKAEAFMKKLVRYPAPAEKKEESLLMYSRLLTTCRNQEIGHLVFAGDAVGENPEMLQFIADKLTQSGVPTECIGDILNNPEAILRLNAGDGVVLIVKAAHTTYRILDEEIAQCVRQNTKLIGFAEFE